VAAESMDVKNKIFQQRHNPLCKAAGIRTPDMVIDDHCFWHCWTFDRNAWREKADDYVHDDAGDRGGTTSSTSYPEAQHVCYMAATGVILATDYLFKQYIDYIQSDSAFALWLSLEDNTDIPVCFVHPENNPSVVLFRFYGCVVVPP
jgi:hypothetical protein